MCLFSWGGCLAGLDIFNKKQETVRDIDIADAAIKIQTQEVHFRIKGLDLFFNALGDDVVGNAAKGLETDDIGNASFGKSNNFSRQQPAFSKLGSHVDNALAVIGHLVDVFKRSEIGESTANLVDFIDDLDNLEIDKIHQEMGNPVMLEVKLIIGQPIDEGLHEKGRHKGRHHLNMMVHEPACDILVGKGVELEVDFSNNPDLRQFYIGFDGIRKFLGRFLEQFQKPLGMVLFDLHLGEVEVLAAQFFCQSLLFFTDDCSIIEF